MTEEQKQLVTDNHNLIYGFLNEHNLSKEDYYGIAAYGLCQAAIAYDKTKASFASYAYQCMLNAVLFEKRKDNANKRVLNIAHLSLDYPIETEDGTLCLADVIPSQDSTQEEALALVILEKYFDTVSERDRKILELSYVGCSTAEIEKIMNVSHTTISKIRNRFKQYIS